MKKKIKDLTIEECQKICNKYQRCYHGCPLFYETTGNCYTNYLIELESVKRANFDEKREVEIDESNND